MFFIGVVSKKRVNGSGNIEIYFYEFLHITRANRKHYENIIPHCLFIWLCKFPSVFIFWTSTIAWSSFAPVHHHMCWPLWWSLVVTSHAGRVNQFPLNIFALLLNKPTVLRFILKQFYNHIARFHLLLVSDIELDRGNRFINTMYEMYCYDSSIRLVQHLAVAPGQYRHLKYPIFE